MLFAAAHESGLGPSRHVAPPRNLGRQRGEAEVEGRRSIAEADAFDPEQTNILL
jgi:hypothetical protein